MDSGVGAVHRFEMVERRTAPPLVTRSYVATEDSNMPHVRQDAMSSVMLNTSVCGYVSLRSGVASSLDGVGEPGDHHILAGRPG